MEFIQSSPCGVVIDLTFGDDDTIMDMNEIDVAGPSTHDLNDTGIVDETVIHIDTPRRSIFVTPSPAVMTFRDEDLFLDMTVIDVAGPSTQDLNDTGIIDETVIHIETPRRSIFVAPAGHVPSKSSKMKKLIAKFENQRSFDLNNAIYIDPEDTVLDDTVNRPQIDPSNHSSLRSIENRLIDRCRKSSKK